MIPTISQDTPVEVIPEKVVRILCVITVLSATVSFRSVPKIVGLFIGGWVPHFTSVINWTLRVGLALLNQVSPIAEPWIAIMDHSIDVGIKKVFVVLRVKLETFQKKMSAITLEDCECVGLKICEGSNGESVASDLKEIFKVSGVPMAILKDGGRDLARGVKIWQQEEDQEQVKVIEDIGHVVANAIKAQYSKSKFYLLFLEIINSFSNKMKQTKFAFLLPPKLRTKGRFQGISRFTDWANKIFEFLNETKEDDDFKILRKSLSGLSQVKIFILNFAKSVMSSSEILKILKNKGLNENTYHQVLELLKLMPKKSNLRKKILIWLQKHIEIHRELNIDVAPLIVSSDIIESLFGKFKYIIGRSPIMEMNRSVLLIPTLCIKPSRPLIMKSLYDCRMKDINQWENKNVPNTQFKLRQIFLGKNDGKKVPKTGDLYRDVG